MPAAAGIEASAVGEWAISGTAVERMAGGIHERIVAATLLAHEFEQLVRQIGIGGRRDQEGQRTNVSENEFVFSRLVEIGEIEFGVVGELAPGHGNL